MTMTKVTSQKPVRPVQSGRPAPQLTVRSGMTAGESVEACQRNLEYWRTAYQNQCWLPR
jgi:hypothetical protein